MTLPSKPVTITPQGLQDRLVEFGVRVFELIQRAPSDVATIHIHKQLARSSTSAAANYAEARSAESRKDFIHKLQICLKELRETGVWLDFENRLTLPPHQAEPLINECNQLISIFVKTVQTAKRTESSPTKSAIVNR